MWQGMAHLPLPLERFFGEYVGMSKTQPVCQDAGIRMSKGALRQVVVAIFEHFHSASFAQALRLHARAWSASSPYQKKQADIVLSSMMMMLAPLAGAIVLDGHTIRHP